jgi:GNAT superfamily N-acetyltransferase
MELRVLRPDDWLAVRAIYQAGLDTGNATFETAVPDWPAWNAAHLTDHRLVARLDDRIVGWTALAPVSDRCAHAGVAEDSIYVAPDAQGRGVGRALLAAVVASAEVSVQRSPSQGVVIWVLLLACGVPPWRRPRRAHQASGRRDGACDTTMTRRAKPTCGRPGARRPLHGLCCTPCWERQTSSGHAWL